MTKFTPNINVKYTIRDQLSKFKNNKKFNTYLHAVNDIINDKETTKQEKINGLNHIKAFKSFNRKPINRGFIIKFSRIP